MNSKEKHKIDQYIQSGTSADQQDVADLFLPMENEPELERMAQGYWESSSTEKVDLQHVLNRIHFDINTGVADDNVSFIRSLFHSYSRIAAVLLLPVLFASAFLVYERLNRVPAVAEIRAPKGSRVQFMLPDGSAGYLNGGSTLKYMTDFDEERLVALSGEGFFEVRKDKEHPFTVQTDVANIQVLGTKFDVCAYADDPEVTTTLEEGSVRVWGKDSNISSLLKPGQQNKFNRKTGKMLTFNVQTDLFTSWKDEHLKFDNAPLADVVTKMERWYGVRILIDPDLQNVERYTMTIRTESLREMIELLSITTPMSYTIKKDTVYISTPKQSVRR